MIKILPVELIQFASWSAFVSAIATVLGLVALVMFFSFGQPWGTVNDISSVVLALSLMPILLVLHQLHRPYAPFITFAAFVIGVLALLTAVVFQSLLIARIIAFAQTAVVVPVAFGLFGASLIIYNGLAYSNELFPHGLAVLGMVAGAGYIVVIAGFILGGQQHPLSSIGGLTAVVCYPIWAIWFGRLLLARKLLG